MHWKVPTENVFFAFYACQKVGINGENPNVGLVPRKDYGAWKDDEDDEIK